MSPTYIKIGIVDGDAVSALKEDNTFNVDESDFGLLNALLDQGYTFSASALNFKALKIDNIGRDPIEFPGPILDPGGPGGPKERFVPDYGPTDSFAFLKISDVEGEPQIDDLAALDELVSAYQDDFRLIKAGDDVFIKLDIDVVRPDNFLKLEALEPTRDTEFVEQTLTQLPDDWFG